MSLQSSSDGKRFLESLILRAETILGKMIVKLTETHVPLEEMVPMINSVYGFVNVWEASLQDISLDHVLNGAGEFAADEAKSREERIMEQVNSLEERVEERGAAAAEGGRRSAVRHDAEAEPMFEFLEQSLNDYIPGRTGICHITHVLPGSTTFYMMDSLQGGVNTQELIKTLQNVTTRMEGLPDSSRRVFGVEVDGQIFRAVRSKPDRQGYPFLWLLDMGDVLPFDERTMRLFQLPAYYQKFQPLAVRCQLVDLVDEPFCGDFSRYLVEHLYAARKFEVCEREELFLRVNLSSVPKGRKNGQVKPVRKPEPIPEYKVSEKTLTQEQLDILFEEPLSTSNAMKATMGFVPQDDKRICPFYDPNIEGCFKGAGCRLQHVSKDPDGWTRDQALHKCKIRAQLIEPRIGTVLEMVPTAVVNVEEFYAHLYLKEYTEGLNKLQQLLNDSANVRGYRRMDHKPYAREYVFARFKDDGRWYRAEVQDYFHDGLIQVQYLDYGNRDQVGIDELRLWEDRFDYLPFQAVHCRLANVSQVRENDFEATLVLSEAILDKKVAVKVLDIRSYWEVLVNLDSEMDVGRFLVHKGVARLRQPIVINDKDGLVPA